MPGEGGKRLKAPPLSTWRGVYVAAGLFLAITLTVLGLLSTQLIHELERVRSASSDNVQWSMAQVQVELLVLERAVDQAIHSETPEALDEVRQRFDIFYSRIDTLRHGSVFTAMATEEDARQTLTRVSLTLDRIIPVIDGPDDELGDALPALLQTFETMNTRVREVALTGVRLLAEKSDRDRQAFTSLLMRTGLVTVGVMAAMFIALFLFVWQFRIARSRTEQLQTQNLLYESAINASLEAIIVSDEHGYILDFNPAAEQLFGYKREHAIGVTAEKLIIPKSEIRQHRRRRLEFLEQYRGGTMSLSGRLEINAMRANGEVFPAEVSVGLTRNGSGRVIVTYMRDISERRRAQQNLTRARDDAVATAKAKSDFLAVMSHEMRTPLNGVMGLLDMLSETRLTRKQQDYVQTAISSGEILQRHIDDVLNITRIEAGVTKLTPSRFDVPALLVELKKMNQPAATTRKNAIETEISPGAEVFQQDRHGLRQVLINLVGNAVKFTDSGTILIKAAPCAPEGWLEFSVSDTGVGISPEDTARIFDDFVMLDPSYKRTAPGSGLGLGISKRIVTLMGGEIGVESQPGEGSRFYVRLPPLDVVEQRPTEIGRTAPLEPEQVETEPLSVLIVEDNETNRFVAREMLAKHGCRIVEAHDGIEGVEKAASQRFDVIFMDVSMPRLDGLGATRAIRDGDGASRDTPIIGLTAHALPEERQKLEEAGMEDCIIKPLRSATVKAVIDRLMQERQGEHARAATVRKVEEGDDGSLIDHATLADLTEALPQDLFHRQLERFKTELAVSQERFCGDGFDSTDLDELASCAHKMAGSAAVFGAVALRAKLQEVESAAKHGNRDQLPPLCNAAREMAVRTLRVLDELTQ